MAELTKERILKLAIEFISDDGLFEAVGEAEWIKSTAFYNAGIADFTKALLQEMEK